MKKRILAGVMASAAALSAMALSGCDDAIVQKVTDDDETLSIVAWASNGDMQSMIDFFCEKTGTPKEKVKWVTVGAGGNEARVEYKGYLDGDEDADIIFCDAGWALEYANQKKYTVPLEMIGIQKSQYSDAYGYTLSIGTNKDGEFVGATWQATPGAYVYRADYAEELLGVKSPAEMQALISDWAKFEETAAKLAEKNVAICATEGGLWQVKQCERTSTWLGSDGKLAVDQLAKDFVKMAKDYADKGYITKENQWDASWGPTVDSGKALGDFAPTWGLLNNGSNTIAENFCGGSDGKKGVLGLCEGPASWYWGGTYMEVANGCNSSSLAKKWIELFTLNEEAMKEYALKYGDFMNNKKAMDTVSKDTSLKNDLFKDGIHQFGVLYNQVDKIKVYVTEYDGSINEKFNAAVQGYALKGETTSVDDAIKAFTDAVAKEHGDLV